MQKRPSQINSLHHLALRVSDLKKSLHFYHQLLGLPKIKDLQDENGALRSIWLKADAVIVMLEQTKVKEETTKQFLAFSIQKKDRKKWEEYLGDQHIPITHETEHSIYFLDPEKNRVALSHYPLELIVRTP